MNFNLSGQQQHAKTASFLELPKLPRRSQDWRNPLGECFVQHPWSRWHGWGVENPEQKLTRFSNEWTVRTGGGLLGLARGWKREVQQVGRLTVDCNLWVRSPRKFSIPFKRAPQSCQEMTSFFCRFIQWEFFSNSRWWTKISFYIKSSFSSRMWLPFVHVDLWFWRTFGLPPICDQNYQLPTTGEFIGAVRAAGRLDWTGLDILI